jgi:hypothetical protein
MAYAIEVIDPTMSASEWAGWLVSLAKAEDEIDAEVVLRDINEERGVAGFPEVRDIALVETVLAERRRLYKNVILAALENVASEVLVEAITRTVAEATSNGEGHAPCLIEDITSAYELRASHAIEKGVTAILAIVDAVRSKASGGDSAVSPDITRIEQLIRQWEKLAQPVQVLAKSRGQEHEKSRNLAYEVRSLCIDLVNEHDLIDQGHRITTMLSGVFAELPEFVERLAADAEALTNLSKQRDDGQRKAVECEASERLFKLGWKYSNGLAVPKDYAKAAKLFHKAAEQGHAVAQHQLGTLYELGRGVPEDYKEALSWYRKAADQGNADSSFSVGLMYAAGMGVVQDDVEAEKWYRLSAAQGDAVAGHLLP